VKQFEIIKQRVLQNNLFSDKRTGTFEIVEGKIRLQFDTSRPVWCIEKIDDRLQCFNKVLTQTKCADVAIWKCDDQNRWTLHIIEAKETVNVSGGSQGWGHIKRQFLGALIRCQMLAGIFGIHFDRVIFCTAFVNDNISCRSKPTPEEYDTEDTSNYRVLPDTSSPWFEWQTGQFHLYGMDWSDDYIAMTFPHRQITLTQSTGGMYEPADSITL
jgi:hypothetical protein